MSASDSRARRGLQLVRARTEHVARDAGRLRALADRASAKLKRHSGALGALRTDVPVLVRLVRAYAKGDYRKVPWKALLFAAGGLVYFVAPVDLIPDFLVGTGYLDDAAVIAYVIKSLRDHLDAYRSWEDSQTLEADEWASTR